MSVDSMGSRLLWTSESVAEVSSSRRGWIVNVLEEKGDCDQGRASNAHLIALEWLVRKQGNFHRRPDEEKRKLIVAAWFIHVVVVAVGLAFTRL